MVSLSMCASNDMEDDRCSKVHMSGSSGRVGIVEAVNVEKKGEVNQTIMASLKYSS